MQLLNDRFELTGFLGEGSQGQTHRATDHSTGEVVALKRLAIEKLDDWKSLELFEREAKVLRSLNHSAIPKYIDAFHIDDAVGRHFYIVQEFVDGSDLEHRLQNGERWDEERAKQVLVELLDVLEYLHGLSPPVVHRDIKPSNIIQRDDGRIVLIDFGSVQNVVQSTVGGSTMSGTPGYMPIEQVMGQSVPASDLFAVGATLVRLMSRKEPSQLPLKKTELQFDDVVNASSDFKRVLRKLLKPSVEKRLGSTSEVSTLLGKSPTSPKSSDTSASEREKMDAPDSDVASEKGIPWFGILLFTIWMAISGGYTFWSYYKFLWMQADGVQASALILERTSEAHEDAATDYKLLVDYGAGRGFVEVSKSTWINADSGKTIAVFYDGNDSEPTLNLGRLKEQTFGVWEVLTTFGSAAVVVAFTAVTLFAIFFAGSS